MSIVINGSGTVAGLSVGGLPDGTVDNDTLAGSIVDGKITGLSASKLTGALPALDGSALTGISGGKILQVKYAYWFPTSNYTISNATTLTNLSITMTPTSSSSKLISTIYFGMLKQSGSDNYVEFRYQKNSTSIDGGSYGLGYSNYKGTYMNDHWSPHSFAHVHDATDTSSRTYNVMTNTGSGAWMIHNGAGNTHIIMEYEV